MKRRVDGILLLDKPVGITSNSALQRVKRLFAAERAGHTGTLDPLASGLLPILLGEATKYASYSLEADKRYEATMRLGQRTTTGDAEGEVIEERAVSVSSDAIHAAVRRFVGNIEQVPPMYSALKRDGRPLYDYARAGVTLERAPRATLVHRIDVRRVALPLVEIDVTCAKGTYVRTLAEDIGESLGCGAHLTALRRTHTGVASIEAAVTLETLEGTPLERRAELLLPIDALLDHLPRVGLDDLAAYALRAGQSTRAEGFSGACEAVAVYGPNQNFLGVGRIAEDGALRARRLVRTDVAH